MTGPAARPAALPAPLLAVAAIVSVQFGSAGARAFFEEVGPTGAAAMRLALGAAILLSVVRPRVARFTPRVWVGVIALGLALGGMNSLIYLSFAHIPMGVAVTVEFTGPLLVALVQTRRWRDAGWAALAFAGVLLLGVDRDSSLAPVGVAFAAGAAACWAAYILLSADLGRRLAPARGASSLDGLAVAMGVAALVVTPFGIAPASAAVHEAPWLLAVFLLIAVLTSALPYALEFVALRRMPTRVFGVLSSLGPAVAAVAGLVVLGQGLSVLQLVALALVTAASVGVTIVARRPPVEPATP